MLLLPGTNRLLKSVGILGLVSLLSMMHLALVRAASPSENFDEAVRLDLQGKAQLAFPFYLRAANAGLSQAQFDVAVMLDSGRGTPQNMSLAAVWYARAAAHGNQRAAYNLGQLYESGEGVPQNRQMAHAWFAASGLAASSEHLRDSNKNEPVDAVTLSAAELIAPSADSHVISEAGGVVLVWTSPPQPVSVTFYVELRSIESSGSNEVFSGSAKTSSIYITIPSHDRKYAWRIITFSSNKGEYIASKWIQFSIAPSG